MYKKISMKIKSKNRIVNYFGKVDTKDRALRNIIFLTYFQFMGFIFISNMHRLGSILPFTVFPCPQFSCSWSILAFLVIFSHC